MYTNHPIIWMYKLQMQVALSTTKTKYIVLSTALRDAISLMLRARELMEKFTIDIYCDAANVYCHNLEDNSGVLKFAEFPEMRPCTKHINIRYQQFRKYVR